MVCYSYVHSISITLQKGAISTITGVLKRERARLSHCVAQPCLFWDIFESPPSVVVVVRDQMVTLDGSFGASVPSLIFDQVVGSVEILHLDSESEVQKVSVLI